MGEGRGRISENLRENKIFRKKENGLRIGKEQIHRFIKDSNGALKWEDLIMSREYFTGFPNFRDDREAEMSCLRKRRENLIGKSVEGVG